MASLRQSKMGGHGGGTSPSVTLDSQAVAGNVLVVQVANGNQNITQTATTGWTQRIARSARDVTVAIYTKVSDGTETTLQPCTLSIAQGGPIIAYEMVDVDVTVLNAQSSDSVAATSATINSVVDGVGFAMIAAFDVDFTSETADNGWSTVPAGYMSGGGNGIGFYHTGVTSATATASWSPSKAYTIVQLTLTDAGGGGGTELTETKTDSLSLGEQIQMVLDMAMGITDEAQLRDPVAIELAMIKAQTDTLALTDITAIELGKFVLLTESIGLTDFTTFIQKTELTESTGLVDQVTTALLYLNGFLDLADITDSYTIELHNNGLVSLTEILGITDTFTISLGGSVSMSLADQVMAWLTGLGYTTGSIQDRQYQFLLDRYTTAFGAPPYSLTTSDLQAALGERVRLVLKEEEYTP